MRGEDERRTHCTTSSTLNWLSTSRAKMCVCVYANESDFFPSAVRHCVVFLYADLSADLSLTYLWLSADLPLAVS